MKMIQLQLWLRTEDAACGEDYAAALEAATMEGAMARKSGHAHGALPLAYV